jgi:hypothetical protein
VTGSSSGLVTDSFNSANTNLSTNGKYDPTKASTNGNVAIRYGPVNLGNHVIAGNLYLGPMVDPSWVGPGSVIGEIRTDYNTCFPDATLPAGIPMPSPIRTNCYYFTSSGYYYLTFGNWPIVVLPGINVQVRVDTTTFNPAFIHVMASSDISGVLSLYQVSGSATWGNVTVDSQDVCDFRYYGLPGVTSVMLGGMTNFAGTIYAPWADFTLNGGGSTNDFAGAIIAKTFTMKGHWVVHFDENLLTAGPMR